MTNPDAPSQKPLTKERSQEVSQPVPAPAYASDTTIARTVARAVRATPGVVDLNPGLLALAATYGVHEQIVGVVVRHTSQHDIVVEVHVTVAMESALRVEGREDVAGGHVQAVTTDGAALKQIANQVREAVYRATADLNLSPPAAVDVLIDDIQ